MKTIDPTLHVGEAAEEVVCQICGDSITVDVVFCRSCKTPHHQDCWQYYGGCSVYGCGGVDCRPATVLPARRL